MSDEDCLTTYTVIWRDVEKIISYRRLKAQNHSVSVSLYCFSFFINILIDNLMMQIFHISNRTMCLSKKILYQYFVAGFLPCLGQLFL